LDIGYCFNNIIVCTRVAVAALELVFRAVQEVADFLKGARLLFV
jgi:hypothetical protein